MGINVILQMGPSGCARETMYERHRSIGLERKKGRNGDKRFPEIILFIFSRRQSKHRTENPRLVGVYYIAMHLRHTYIQYTVWKCFQCMFLSCYCIVSYFGLLGFADGFRFLFTRPIFIF